MEPVRILHIVTYMGRGGLESMLMNYYRHIDRSKIQFDFLVHREFEADYDQEILAMGGKIYHISRLIPWSRAYKGELRAFFKRHPEYQIVHVHQDCLSSVALQCAQECGVPVRIGHAHSSSAIKNLKYPIKAFYKRSIAKYATDLFACSRAAGEWMFSCDRFQVLNNAVDLQRYAYDPETARAVREELRLEHQFVVGHVGRFREEKNHEFLIDVFATLEKKHPQSVLLLVGDGALQQAMEEKVCKAGLTEKVRFLGARSDVHRLVQAMDVFVFPSLYEGMPVTMVEAQAAGLPCVISDTIPMECVMTEQVTAMSLQSGAEMWADKIWAQRGVQRGDTCEEISRAGFDIHENARRLQEFYLAKHAACGREEG